MAFTVGHQPRTQAHFTNVKRPWLRLVKCQAVKIRDLKQRGQERERRRLRKITFLVYSLLLCAGHLSFVSLL